MAKIGIWLGKKQIDQTKPKTKSVKLLMSKLYFLEEKKKKNLRNFFFQLKFFIFGNFLFFAKNFQQKFFGNNLAKKILR